MLKSEHGADVLDMFIGKKCCISVPYCVKDNAFYYYILPPTQFVDGINILYIYNSLIIFYILYFI
jgi:hypothetical protein